MKSLAADAELLDEWLAQLEKSKSFHIAVALVTKTGLDQLIESLESQLEEGGRGEMLVGTDLPTDPQSLSILQKLHSRFPEKFEVRRFQSDSSRFFHPKLSIFVNTRGRKTAIIGSSNLTGGGLSENIEANVLFDSPKEVDKLLKFFNVLFLSRNSQSISTAWLAEYRKRWADRKKASDAMRRSRVKIGRIRVDHPRVTSIPKRIKGGTFVFTGGLGNGWNRSTALKKVRGYGGTALDTHASVKRADCLVEGNINPYWDSTRKLEVAREYEIPIIGPDEFLRVYEKEKRLRKKKKA